MEPTWGELIEKNRAAASLPIAATVHHSFNTATGWTAQRVWTEPDGRRRIDDADGVRTVVGERDVFVRLPDGRMGWSERRPDQRPPLLDPRFIQPVGLLDMHLAWPAPTPPEPERAVPENGNFLAVTIHRSRRESPQWAPRSAPQETWVRGRKGWTVDIGFDTGVRGEIVMPWTFDDETGVIIGLHAGGSYNVTELSDVVVGEPIDPQVFTYAGTWVDAARAQEEEQDRLQAAADGEEHFRNNLGAGNDIDAYLDRDQGTLLVRTDFSDDDAWRELIPAINDDRNGLMGAGLPLVDNRKYEGWTTEDFLGAFEARPWQVVLADATTFSHPDRPVLYLRLTPADADWTERGHQVRVAADSVALTQANLDVSNLFLSEMTPDHDGILRMEWLG